MPSRDDLREDERQFEICKKKSEWKKAAIFANFLGVTYLENGDGEKSMEWHKNELEMAEKVARGKITADVAIANRMMGQAAPDFDQGLDLFLKYLELSQRLCDNFERTEHEQLALHKLGEHYMNYAEDISPSVEPIERTDYYRKAVQYFRSSESKIVSLKCQDKQLRHADLLYNIGLCLLKIPGSQSAEKYIQRAMNITKKSEDSTRHVTYCYGFIQELMRMHGRFELIVEHLETMRKGVEIMPAGNPRKMRFFDYYLLSAQFHTSRSKFHEAIEELKLMKKRKIHKRNEIKFESLAKTIVKLEKLSLTNRKQLEKGGDILSNAGLYILALEYYEKWLTLCPVENLVERQLAVSSIAMTNMDIEDYSSALNYHLQSRQIEISVNQSVKDQIATVTKIIFCMIMVKKDGNACEIQEQVKQLMSLAEKSSSKNAAREAYEVILNYKDSFGWDISEKDRISIDVQQNIDLLGVEDEELLEEQSMSDVESDVDLHEILAVEEDVENEKPEEMYASGRVRRLKQTKKNIVGEETVHQLCKLIHGDNRETEVATKLCQLKRHLAEGYRVTVVDFGNWYPIHEAANCGFHEAIEVLVSFKANVNIRGGKCQITPLMDAASGGHTQFCTILLHHGAHNNLVDTSGWTAWHYFEDYCHSRFDSWTPEEKQEALKCKRMLDPGPKLRQNAAISKQRMDVENMDLEENLEQQRENRVDGAKAYKEGLAAVRKKRKAVPSVINRPERQKAAALIDEDTFEAQNNWLAEDDDVLVEKRPIKRHSHSPRRQTLARKSRVILVDEEDDVPEPGASHQFMTSTPLPQPFSHPHSLPRFSSDQPLDTTIGMLLSTSRDDAPSSPGSSVSTTFYDPDIFTKLIVNCQGFTKFKIPIPIQDKGNTVEQLKIKICDVLGRKKKDMKMNPGELELLDEDACELLDDFTVGEYLNPNTSTITVRITPSKWQPHVYYTNNAPSPVAGLMAKLMEVSKSHILTAIRCALGDKEHKTWWEALVFLGPQHSNGCTCNQCMTRITHIDLSDNRLHLCPDNLAMLISQSPGLTQLILKNASLNDQVFWCLNTKLSNIKLRLQKLTYLDLSGNTRLCKSGTPNVIDFLQFTPNLTTLKLSSMNLSANFFASDNVRNVFKNDLCALASLDVSKNASLCDDSMHLLFDSLPCSSLKSLNISQSFTISTCHMYFLQELSNYCAKPGVRLEELDMSGVEFNVDELDRVSVVFTQLTNLTSVTLSCAPPADQTVMKILKLCSYDSRPWKFHFHRMNDNLITDLDTFVGIIMNDLSHFATIRLPIQHDLVHQLTDKCDSKYYVQYNKQGSVVCLTRK